MVARPRERSTAQPLAFGMDAAPPGARALKTRESHAVHDRSVTMSTTLRTTISSLAFGLLLVLPRPAVAQTTVIIGNGTIAPEFDGSLNGLHLTGDDTQLNADYLGGVA